MKNPPHMPPAQMAPAHLCGKIPTRLNLATWGERYRVTARAGALLHEVHRLASAYGWSETDVLAMSAMRRGVYLELARGGS